MSRSAFRGPKLPRELLDQVSNGRVNKRNHQQTRKERRKAERAQKRPQPTKSIAKPLKPALKQSKPAPQQQPAELGELEDEDDFEDFGGDDDTQSDNSSDNEDDYPAAQVVPKAVKARLEEDDAEIRALEKKLGMRGKSSKRVGDDELDWLIGGGLSSEDEDGFALSARKRPATEDEDWLKNKRRKAAEKAAKAPDPASEDEEDNSGSEDEDVDDFADFESDDDAEVNDGEEEDDDEDIENPFSDDELSDGDMASDDADAEKPSSVQKQRENPYVAPAVHTAPSGKYVPPSLRKAASNDEEMLKQLQRQLNGQLNKLSESNMLSILSAVQEIYAKNARGHVTSVLTELFKNRVCDRSALTDNEMILLAGFAAAVYRTTGPDFGAPLLEGMVEAFDRYHAQNSDEKQTLNILAFLSNSYTLQTLGCEVIFDYIRMLLDNFSEANTELLLRVIRISGTQLRQDDPSSLKDIVLLLQRAITAAGGAEKVSVRTKFMIETIHNLKNNRTKAGGAGSVSSLEHTTRMKKTLGQIKSTKTTEPLRISLADIRDSEKKGKWWLVGASWRDPAKMVNGASEQPIVATAPPAREDDAAADSEPEEVDFYALAKAQGMNTDVRRAIFVSIIGAVDPTHAQLRIQKLNLKNKQQLEIPRVVLHFAAAEPIYNHFYTLVGLHFCYGHKMAKAWQFALYDVYRRIDADDDDEDSGEGKLEIKSVYNIAKLYATLVAEGHLRIILLKPLPFMTLSVKAKVFAEVMLATLLVLLRKKHGKEAFGKHTEECFGRAHAVPDMVKGLDWFLENVVPESKAPFNSKERKVIRQGIEYAVEALRDERRMARTARDDGDEEDD